jgi:DNA-binding LacI/PurR family transcriptional regulator
MGRTRSNQFQSKQIVQSPIYQQLAERIQTRLMSGDSDGKQLPGIRELSTMFDVNYLTARQALKHLESKGLVSMQTGRGTFATSLKSRPLTIGVIVPDLSYKINSSISRGIRLAAGARNVVPVFMDFHNDSDVELECLQRLQSEKIEAALIYPSLKENTRKTLFKLILSGYPVVFVDRAPTDVPCWSISSNDWEIGRLAATHLVECGAKVPGCVMAELPNVRDRLRGFQQGLNDMGVALPQSRIFFTTGSEFETTRELTRAMMKLSPRPDGVFYLSDQHALVGLRQLHDLGIRVPSEVMVVGSDDIEATLHSLPTLTTIKQNALALGREAFQMLCESLSATLEDRLCSRHVNVGVELVARESTRAPHFAEKR